MLHIGRHQRPAALLGPAGHSLADRAVRRAPVAPDGAGAARAADRRGLEPLDEEAVREAARELGAAGRRGGRGLLPVLVPRPGARAARGGDPARGAAGLLRCTSSADIFPQFREFERFTTACHERVRRAGDRRVPRAPGARRCAATGWPPSILVMRSNGGVASVAEAAGAPGDALLSGPAAGVLGASWAGALAGRRRLDHLRHGRHLGRHRRSSTEAGVAEASARDTADRRLPAARRR